MNSTAGQGKPRFRKRFLDDVSSILKWENLVAFFAYIYPLDEQISFNPEEEENGGRPFLDVAVQRTTAGRLRTTVFGKRRTRIGY